MVKRKPARDNDSTVIDTKLGNDTEFYSSFEMSDKSRICFKNMSLCLKNYVFMSKE